MKNLNNHTVSWICVTIIACACASCETYSNIASYESRSYEAYLKSCIENEIEPKSPYIKKEEELD